MSVLEVFRSLPTAHDVCRDETLPDGASAYARDTVTLGWEDRLKARGRRTTDGGVEFGTALPRGTALRQDDCLVVDALRLVVVVIEREEPVLVVRPAERVAGGTDAPAHSADADRFAGRARPFSPARPDQWGLIGYHIGNSHQPVMFTADEIVCADLPGMDLVLSQHGIPFTRERRRFAPVGLLGDHRH